MRIEAAAYRGKPDYFELIGPWTRPERQQPDRFTAGISAFLVGFIVVLLSMIVVGTLLARRNLRLGRSDETAPFVWRFSFLGLEAMVWLFGAHHALNFYESRLSSRS